VQPLLWASGIVGVHQMGDSLDARAFKAFQALHQNARLGLRVLYYLPLTGLDSAITLGLRSGLGDSRLRVGGVKLFADGSLGSRTAWMFEPFASNGQSCGVPWMTPEDLRGEISRAIQAGLAVAVHAIGDRANHEVIDAIAAAQSAETPIDGASSARPLRHRIEHVQLLRPDDITRLARCRITTSMQPIHCASDMDMADQHWGKPRAAGAFAWRNVLASGAPLCFGSDSPVEPFNVLAGIHAAVTRRRPDGYPGPDGWHSEQRLSVSEAVHAYTMGAAYAAGDEQHRGSISVGKLADLTVLSGNIFSCPPDAILQTDVLMTLFDGQIVHNAL
jgi:predicted amidohydrolase YtcJ